MRFVTVFLWLTLVSFYFCCGRPSVPNCCKNSTKHENINLSQHVHHHSNTKATSDQNNSIESKRSVTFKNVTHFLNNTAYSVGKVLHIVKKRQNCCSDHDISNPIEETNEIHQSSINETKKHRCSTSSNNQTLLQTNNITNIKNDSSKDKRKIQLIVIPGDDNRFHNAVNASLIRQFLNLVDDKNIVIREMLPEDMKEYIRLKRNDDRKVLYDHLKNSVAIERNAPADKLIINLPSKRILLQYVRNTMKNEQLTKKMSDLKRIFENVQMLSNSFHFMKKNSDSNKEKTFCLNNKTENIVKLIVSDIISLYEDIYDSVTSDAGEMDWNSNNSEEAREAERVMNKEKLDERIKGVYDKKMATTSLKYIYNNGHKDGNQGIYVTLIDTFTEPNESSDKQLGKTSKTNPKLKQIVHSIAIDFQTLKKFTIHDAHNNKKILYLLAAEKDLAKVKNFIFWYTITSLDTMVYLFAAVSMSMCLTYILLLIRINRLFAKTTIIVKRGILKK